MVHEPSKQSMHFLIGAPEGTALTLNGEQSAAATLSGHDELGGNLLFFQANGETRAKPPKVRDVLPKVTQSKPEFSCSLGAFRSFPGELGNEEKKHLKLAKQFSIASKQSAGRGKGWRMSARIYWQA